MFLVLLKSFLPNVPILNPMETPENLWFIKREHWLDMD